MASLVWLARIIIVESGASSSLQRAFAALMLLAAYPAGATIGNGQLTVHVITALTAGLLILYRQPRRWRRDVLGSLLILVSLAKPSVSAPLFWLVLFSMPSIRPALLVIIGYGGLTALAVSFQDASTASLLRDWMTRSGYEVTHGAYADLNLWLHLLGLDLDISAASLAALAAVGVWVYRYHYRDLWIQIGVVAIVARFWMHHRWYDDLLIVLPMVTLFRLAVGTSVERGASTSAGVLLGVTMLLMIAPGGLYLFPSPWNIVYVVAQTIVWFAIIAYLLREGAHLPVCAGRHQPGPAIRSASTGR